MKQTLLVVGFKKTVYHEIPYNRTRKDNRNKLFTPDSKNISKLANKLEHKQDLKNNEMNEMHSKIEETTLDIKTEPESYEDQNLESNQMNSNTDTGKSLSEALLFGEHGENMSCTEMVLNVENNFCTQHVLPMFLAWNFHVLNL